MVLIVKPMSNQIMHQPSSRKPAPVKKVATVDGKGITELVNKLKEVKVKNDDLKDIRITL